MPAPQTPAPRPEHAPDPRRGRILLVLLGSLFMSLVAVSIMNVTLPSLQRDLGASSSALQWVISGYALALGVVLVAGGRAGDLFGRERVFMVGLTVFIAASASAALAPTDLWLNLSRVVMGLGSGMMNPQLAGLIQQHYQGAERARAFGLFGGVVGVAVSVGPVIGGLLLGALPPDVGWRATLGINVPIGLAIAALGLRNLDLRAGAGPTQRRSRDLDPVGALLLTVAILLIMLPFIMGSGTPASWWLLPVGLLALGAWLVWERAYERRGRAPMVDLGLFRIRSFRMGSLMIGVHFMGATSIWVVTAQLVQSGAGASALAASLIGLPASVLTIFSAQLAGRLVMRIGRWIVVIGQGLVLTGLLLTVAVLPPVISGTLPLWVMAVTLAPVGMGAGSVTSPNQTLTLRDIPVQQGSTASAIMQTGQRIGTALGNAAIMGLFFHLVPAGYGAAGRAAFLAVALVVLVAGSVAVLDALGGRRGHHGTTTPA